MVAFRTVECPAFLVIALGRSKIEALAGRDVMRQEIARDSLVQRGTAGVERNHIDDPGTAIDPHDKRLHALEWHQQ